MQGLPEAGSHPGLFSKLQHAASHQRCTPLPRMQVWQLEGVDAAASKPKDPAYNAIVRDPSGYARLVYRANNNCRPSNVKRGKYYLLSGRVTSHRGRLQVQIGSSWGRLEHVNGHEVRACV